MRLLLEVWSGVDTTPRTIARLHQGRSSTRAADITFGQKILTPRRRAEDSSDQSAAYSTQLA
jgi:hypothetical protein